MKRDAEMAQRATQDQTEAAEKRTEEMERKVKAEGLDLDHPEGKERFEELLKRAAKPKK